ncbi:hypothetical protein SNE40_000521 [Patella caerulea]|uniref:Uncharacterized protein n=1 Tax=Patella caerulea TaxID=87958 RepID=A0AAN8KAM4_PATCE
MGIDIDVWRFKIGLYRHRSVKNKMKQSVLKCNMIMSVLIVLNMLLVLAGDVEMNPGPSGTRQGQISKTGDVIFPQSDNSKGRPSDNELAAILQSLKTDIAEFRQEVRDMNIKEEIVNLKSEIQELRTENVILKDRLDNFENRLKERNVLIFGLKENERETFEECLQLVRDILVNEFRIEGANSDSIICIERTHRVGKKNHNSPNPRPILVSFNRLKGRDLVLSTGRKYVKSAVNSQIRVGEDFSSRVRSIRRALIPKLKEAKSNDENVKAFLKYDKLIIGKSTYTYVLDKKEIICLDNK